MSLSSLRAAALLVALYGFPAYGFPIKEFRKFSKVDQSTFIVGAVSMVIYNHAASGNAAKARCIQNWFFSAKGANDTPQLTLSFEIMKAERRDAERLHVEGVILGVTDNVCPDTAPKKAP